MAFDAFCCGIACAEVRNAVPEGRPKAIVRNEWHVGLLLGLRPLLPIDRRQLTALTKTDVSCERPRFLHFSWPMAYDSGARPRFRPFFWPMAYGSCERPGFRPFFWPMEWKLHVGFPVRFRSRRGLFVVCDLRTERHKKRR